MIRTMFNIIRSIISPILSMALLMMGNGYFTTFLSVRMTMDGYSASVVGYIHAAYYAGFLLGAIYVEKLISRVRHIRAYAIFASLCTAIFLMQGMFIEPISWIILRFGGGLSLAALYVVIESWFLVIGEDKTRGRILALYMVSLYSAQAVSQFFLDVFDTMSLYPFMFCACLCAISVIPVGMTKSKIPELDHPTFGEIFKIMKKTPFALTCCFLSGVILTSIYSFSPVFAEKSGIPVAQLMFYTLLGGLVIQWPIGKFSDSFDRRKILAAVNLLMILPSVSIYLFPMDIQRVYIASFFLGGLSFSTYPVGIALACDRLRIEQLIPATGVLLLAYSIGSVLGPLIAPAFMYEFGVQGFFLLIAMLGGLIFVYGVIQSLRKPPIPEEEHAAFVSLPRVTPVAYELIPAEEQDKSP